MPISNSMKEIGQRYDFKGSASKLERTEEGLFYYLKMK